MIASEIHRNVLNFILFQTGWLVCVLFPSRWSVAVIAVLLVAHFALVSQRRFAELQFIGLGLVLGSLMDTLWFRTGILGIAGEEEAIQAAPPWLVAIWAIFMTTLCHSLYWVGRTRWLPFVLAPIAGPFAYWSASKLGIVTLPDTLVSLAAMAVGWLVLFPLLLFIRRALYTELETS
ncbi:Protein of unknown function [Marinobacter persicus]|uniref:DUF2878 domain-containing protein n=1 Tax=Marinobacter persicus TaxID=930118 RepID=A0A1I3W6Q3_9GAMM|nr:DUF2878 domain-containing protein [Marinobacter persicus]GHD46767.1 hypothetical protein GCM10008110_13800 [Marinobacter persicus]SFK02377.1 Protein of unknown function [Marinobacter persicus]